MRKTIFCADGFNGKCSEFDVQPIETDGSLLKLGVSGRPWLTTWVRLANYNKLIGMPDGGLSIYPGGAVQR
jgi:hypothetical protein